MKYSFFPGCAHETSAGYKESLDAVCQKLDIELVEVPDWNCCGATITAGKSKASSLYLAARSFALSEKNGFSNIVTGCNACYTTLRKSADILFANKQQLEKVNLTLKQEGLNLSKKITIQHLMDVLFNGIEEDIWKSHGDEALKEINIACYYGCQYSRPWLKGRKSEHPEFLENMLNTLGFNAVDHSAKTQCCGAAGAMPNVDIARTLVGRIADRMKKAGCDAAITICPLCQFNMDSLQAGSKAPAIPILFFTQLIGLYFKIEPERLGLDKLLVNSDVLIQKFEKLKITS